MNNKLTVRNTVLFVILLNFFVGMGLLYNFKRQKDALKVYASEVTRTQANILTESLQGKVKNIELALFMVSHEFERILAKNKGKKLNNEEVEDFLHSVQQQFSEEIHIRASDENGLVIIGDGVDKKDYKSWTTHDFFPKIKNNANKFINISDPIFGKVSNAYIISFATRYNYPDGRFAGVIAVPVPIEYLTKLLSTIENGKNGIALLRDSTGGLIARYPEKKDILAGQIGNKGFSPEMQEAMNSGKETVSFYTEQASDGATRVNTYKRLSFVPFHLVVGIDFNELVDEWIKDHKGMVYWYSMFVLLTVFGAIKIIKFNIELPRPKRRGFLLRWKQP